MQRSSSGGTAPTITRSSSSGVATRCLPAALRRERHKARRRLHARGLQALHLRHCFALRPVEVLHFLFQRYFQAEQIAEAGAHGRGVLAVAGRGSKVMGLWVIAWGYQVADVPLLLNKMHERAEVPETWDADKSSHPSAAA